MTFDQEPHQQQFDDVPFANDNLADVGLHGAAEFCEVHVVPMETGSERSLPLPNYQ